jgi:cell wall-associated NlpC family hydrolase
LLPVRRLLRVLIPVGLAVGVFATATTAQAAPSASDLQQQIDKSANQVEKIIEQFNKLNDQLKNTRQQSTAIAAKLAPMEQQVNDAQVNVGQLAASAYKTGNLSGLSAVLGAGSNGSVVERLSILDQLSKSRSNEVAGFNDAKQKYEAQKAGLDALAAQQAAQIKQLAAGKTKIEADLVNLRAMQAQAGISPSVSTPYTGSIPAVSGKAGIVVRFAYKALGAHYAFAQAGPYDTGYDCSGLVMAAWGAAGVVLPHNADEQYNNSHVNRYIGHSDLKPGDLVFYNSFGHVAIYVGGGQVIHAPQENEVVKVSSVDMMPIDGYGRVVG